MKAEKRGSEKLKTSCSCMSSLSQEEIEQIAGAGLLSSPMGMQYQVAFPHGIPWPEIFNQGALGSLEQGLTGAGAGGLIRG